MKILVVGGAGYVGSVTCERLIEAGHDVTILDLMMFGDEPILHMLAEDKVSLIRGDMRDDQILSQAMRGQDAVVLLAAIVGEPACNRDPQAAIDINLHGSKKVLSAAKAAGVQRFVFSSTCSNYGAANTKDFVTEEGELQPISTYADTKVNTEKDVLAASDGSFCTTVLRISTAFGISHRMRFDLLVSDFTLAAMRDRKLEVYGEQFWRPFVHIRDIARAIQIVLEARPETVQGEVFNVGCNESNVQKIELAKSVQRHVPDVEIKFIRGNQDPRSYRVDFTKIKETLAFQPEWTIDAGISELKSALESGTWENTSDGKYYN